jgi:hypothetical protein
MFNIFSVDIPFEFLSELEKKVIMQIREIFGEKYV